MIEVAGASIDNLGYQVNEHFNAGQKVNLYLCIDRALTSEEVQAFENSLRQQGLNLTSPIRFGSGPWDNTLNVQFTRPAYSKGVGFLSLPMMMVGAAGFIVVTIIGWKFVSEITKTGNILIIGGLIAGTIILVQLIKHRAPA